MLFNKKLSAGILRKKVQLLFTENAQKNLLSALSNYSIYSKCNYY